MEKSTFWLFTITFVLFLITVDFIILINVALFFDEKPKYYDDRKAFLKESYSTLSLWRIIPQAILAGFIWWLIYLFIAWMGDFTKTQKAFLGPFLKSPFAIFVACIDLAIVALIIAADFIFSTDLLEYRSIMAERAALSIDTNIERINKELKEIEKSIDNCKDKKTKEVYRESKEKFEEQLRAYEKFKRENADLQAMLSLKMERI